MFEPFDIDRARQTWICFYGGFPVAAQAEHSTVTSHGEDGVGISWSALKTMTSLARKAYGRIRFWLDQNPMRVTSFIGLLRRDSMRLRSSGETNAKTSKGAGTA